MAENRQNDSRSAKWQTGNSERIRACRS